MRDLIFRDPKTFVWVPGLSIDGAVARIYTSGSRIVLVFMCPGVHNEQTKMKKT